METPIDHVATDKPEAGFREVVRWWEKKRLLFNVVPAVIGIVSLAVLANGRFPAEMVGVAVVAAIIYAIAANVCYTFGMTVELLYRHYFGSDRSFSNGLRWLLWLGGTSLTAMLAGIPILTALV